MLELNTYLEDMEKQELVSKEMKNISKLYKDKTREVENSFYEKIRDLKNQQYEALRLLKDEEEAKLDRLLKKKEEFNTSISEYQHAINMLEVYKKKSIHSEDYVVYQYGYDNYEDGRTNYSNKVKQYYEAIDNNVVNTPYLNLSVYITDNEKPKNCYSLIIVGDTLFSNSSCFNGYKEYGIKAHTNGASIQVLVKDFSSKELAKQYYAKHGLKKIKDMLSYFEGQYEFFNEVVNAYEADPKLWENQYLLNKKTYYEQCYSGYEQQEEYISVCKHLEEI